MPLLRVLECESAFLQEGLTAHLPYPPEVYCALHHLSCDTGAATRRIQRGRPLQSPGQPTFMCRCVAGTGLLVACPGN